MAGTLIVSNLTTDTDNTFIVRSNTGTTLFSANTTGIDVANSIGATAITNDKILSVANTKISGNIISSQITSVANTQITGNITAAQLASTLDLSSKTLTLPSSSVREYQLVEAGTTSNRQLNGDSGWVTHLTVSFTANQSCTVFCHVGFAHGYENGAVALHGKFLLDSTTSTTESAVFKQGFSNNMSFGSHNLHGFFTSVAAGAHTIDLQLRNYAPGTNAILNYFDDYGAGDRMFVLFK